MKIKDLIQILETMPPDAEATMIKHTYGVVNFEEIERRNASAPQGRVYDIVVIISTKEKENE